jgi:hypothetical protein
VASLAQFEQTNKTAEDNFPIHFFFLGQLSACIESCVIVFAGQLHVVCNTSMGTAAG